MLLLLLMYSFYYLKFVIFSTKRADHSNTRLSLHLDNNPCKLLWTISYISNSAVL